MKNFSKNFKKIFSYLHSIFSQLVVDQHLLPYRARSSWKDFAVFAISLMVIVVRVILIVIIIVIVVIIVIKG